MHSHETLHSNQMLNSTCPVIQNKDILFKERTILFYLIRMHNYTEYFTVAQTIELQNHRFEAMDNNMHKHKCKNQKSQKHT